MTPDQRASPPTGRVDADDPAPAGPRRLDPRLLIVLGIVAVAINARAAINAVGPLVPTIRSSLAVDNVAMGIVGTLPVLFFGAVAPIAPALGRRFGIGRTLASAMALTTVALVVRSLGSYTALAIGTVLLGVAIATVNVLVPALIKSAFPRHVGRMTSLYGTVMVVAATVAATIAVPVARSSSWERSLGVWAVPALLATMVVAVSVWADDRSPRAGRRDPSTTDGARKNFSTGGGGISARVMHRSRLAWHVTAFMGLQSMLFYTVAQWLPDILIERGMSDVAAGQVVGVLNLGGLVGVLVFPALAGRGPDQRWYGAGSATCSLLGLVAFTLPGTALAFPAAVVFGVGAGGTLGMALMFVSERADGTTDAAALSGMAQTWGYLISAFGPLVWGVLRDATGGWTVPLLLLVGTAMITVASGYAAGRDRTLGVLGT